MPTQQFTMYQCLTVSLQAIILIVMLIGISGNALTITAICKFRRLRTVGNALIGSLCVSDLLYLVLILPIRFATFHHRSWLWNDEFCMFVGAGSHFFVGMSVFTQAMIAVNRVMQIVFTSKYKKIYTKRFMTLQIIFMWLIMMFLTIILPCARIWGHHSYKKITMSCTFDQEKDRGYRIMILTVGIFLPLAMIILSYSTILIYVRASQKKIQEWSNKSRNPTLSLIHASGMAAGQNQVFPAEPREGTTHLQPAENVTLDQVKKKSSLSESLTSSSSDDKKGLLKNRANQNLANKDKQDIEIQDLDDEVFTITEEGTEIKTKETKREKRVSTVTTTSIVLERTNYIETKEFTQEMQKESYTLLHTSVSQDVRLQDENHSQQGKRGVSINESEKNTFSADTNLAMAGTEGHIEPTSPTTKCQNSAPPRRLSNIAEEIPGQRNGGRNELVTNRSLSTGQEPGQAALVQRHEREACKITTMMGMIFIIYLVCTMPYFVINIAYNDVDEHPMKYLITLMITWLDSCLNPIVYAIMNSQFKSAYKELLTRGPCCNIESNSSLEQSVGH